MSGSKSLKVVAVESKRDWHDFFYLRQPLYRHDSNAVFPFRFMEKKLLNDHPFYLHASKQAFNCYQNNQIVGRIVAIKDDLHNAYYNDKVGFVGFFESTKNIDVAAGLFEAAGNWLLENNCTSARGPVSPSMKGEFGVVVKGNDDPPFVMMGYSPAYYESLFLENGFGICREFNAYLYDVPTYLNTVMKNEHELRDVTDKVLRRYPQLRIGNVNKATLEKQLRAINVLGNKARSDGWGFVPMTDEELDFMVHQLKKIVVPETLLVAYWDDKLVGYCINIPCINWALRKCWGKSDWIRLPQFLYWVRKTERSRVIALGADHEYRKRGVGVLLSSEMRYRGVRDLRFKQWEFSWVDTENTASIRAIGRTMPLVHYKTLRLYEKQLTVS